MVYVKRRIVRRSCVSGEEMHAWLVRALLNLKAAIGPLLAQATESARQMINDDLIKS